MAERHSCVSGAEAVEAESAAGAESASVAAEEPVPAGVAAGSVPVEAAGTKTEAEDIPDPEPVATGSEPDAAESEAAGSVLDVELDLTAYSCRM